MNAATGLGIKRNGLNMATCNLIFWNVVVPTTIYGCEIWVLNDDDIDKIETFQKQAGRRIQRFAPDSPPLSSFFSLGWMDLCTYICARKLNFIYTILKQDGNTMTKELLMTRAKRLNENIPLHIKNCHRSIIYEILKVSYNFGLYNCPMGMIFGRHLLSKNQWKSRI